MRALSVNNKRSPLTLGFAIAILTLVFLAAGDQSMSRVASLLHLTQSVIGATALRQLAPKAVRSAAGQTPRQESWQDQRESLAAAGDLDPSFNPGTGATIAGTVYAMVIQGDGKIVLGGSFSSYNGVSCNGLARVNNDGSLDPSFNPGTPLSSIVYALAIQNDGKILLGGLFTSYNGVSRRRIARINSDGSLDPSFDPGTGSNTAIRALALQSDGKILLGADFGSYNGVFRGGFARVNSDGSLDMSFNPGPFGVGKVYALAIQTDGKILVGGDIVQYNGVDRRGIARANSDGSLDMSFNPGAGISGGIANRNVVNALAIQTDGKILLAGEFSKYDNVLTVRVARVNSNGSLDTSFNSGTAAQSEVDSLAIQNDGKILLGSPFFSFNGVIRRGIARVNGDGSLDTSFDPGTGATGGRVKAIAIQNDGKLLLGGSFSSYNSGNRSGIARANSDGSLDSSFDPGTGAAQAGVVKAINLQNDGKILLAGSFIGYNGVSRNGIVRVNSDGSLDPSFNPGAGADSEVSALAIQGDGKILIGGVFASYNGVSRGSIARLNIDGSLDPSFDPGTGANNPVSAVAIQSDGKILLGGFFGAYNGVSRFGIARVNSDGSLDMSFNPGLGLGANAVDALAIQSDGKILLGGLFTSSNSSNSGIARINSDGGLDSSFNSGTDYNVDALAIQSDEKILVGGSAFSFSGDIRPGIARLNNNGSFDTSFDSGTGADDSVNALAIQNDGKVLLGGAFFKYNGVSRFGIARVSSNGSLDMSFNPGSGTGGGPVYSLALQSDGKILLGGGFGSYNGVGRNGIARILNDVPPTVQFSAANYNVSEGDGAVTVTVTRSGDTSGASTVDFVTSDGTATQNRKYEITTGTLSFAAGETSKTFAVLIVDEAFVEGNQSLNVTLGNATGAILAAPSTATITIMDNDSTSLTSPAPKRFAASLNGGQETPPNNSTSKGTGLVLFNQSETSALVGLLFQNLGSAETAAHIHGAGGPGVMAPILFPLPTTNPVINFTINPTAQQVADLKAGLHYQNVHSANFANGEIRGQLLWNPTLEENFLVRQQYLDFLSRESDPGGFNFWVNTIASCQADAQCYHDRTISTADAFFFEPEFQQTAGFVFRAYRAAYGNAQPFPNPDNSNPIEANKLVDYSVYVADRARVVGGANLAAAQQAFASLFVSRTEFTNTYGAGLTGPQFVDAILATMQSADGIDLTAQRQALIDQYNNAGGGNAGRGMVLYRLADDNAQSNPINNRAFIDAEYNRQFALTLYFGYLRRNPDIGGFLFWQSQINSAPIRDVPKQNALVCSFVTAAEYQFRFGPNAPRSNAECPQ